MQFDFSAEVFEWRGPSPFHFVAVPPAECDEIRVIARAVTYGWGVIPAKVRIGGTEWSTSLFPKDGGYLVPLRDAVRHAEGLQDGDVPLLRLTIGT